jgi:hypothetical protein
VAAVKKPHRGQFQPGNPGGGRPLGSRNRLSEIALAALGADFAEHGPTVIAQVRRERPHHYLSIVASLCPRQLNVERTSQLGELTDAELQELELHLAAVRARLVERIEQHNGAQSFPLASPETVDVKKSP